MAVSEQDATSQAVAPRSLAHAAYQALRERIVRCELEPGRRVTEAELSRDTGLGKTPVREALTRLIQDGLMRSIPGHGYAIAPITLQDVQDLFDYRLIVEPAAVRLAAGRIDAARLRRLDELCGAGYSPGDPESASAFNRVNAEFHLAIATASGNRRLSEAVGRLLDETQRLFYLQLLLRNRNDLVAHEHKALVEALVAGDGESAATIAVEHIRETQRDVIEVLLTSPTLLQAPVAAPARGEFGRAATMPTSSNAAASAARLEQRS